MRALNRLVKFGWKGALRTLFWHRVAAIQGMGVGVDGLDPVVDHTGPHHEEGPPGLRLENLRGWGHADFAESDGLAVGQRHNLVVVAVGQPAVVVVTGDIEEFRSEEHTSEL